VADEAQEESSPNIRESSRLHTTQVANVSLRRNAAGINVKRLKTGVGSRTVFLEAERQAGSTRQWMVGLRWS